MKRIALLCLSFFALASGAWAIQKKAIVIDQPNAPLKIKKYTAAYQEAGRYDTKGIHHSVEYTNTGTQLVVAVEIGLVSFDVWNQFLKRTLGFALDNIPPEESGKGTWVTRAYADYSFLTGIAYVSRVRFEDGTIWNADLDAVADEIRKIEKDFDTVKLREPIKEE